MESEFKFLYKTVIDASSIARNYINSPGILKNKDKDIKTKVDVDVNNFIINNLSKTGIPILSEESDNNAISLNDDIWIVDPLDGTLNFTRKFPISAISIALFKKGKPHLGIIYDIFNNNFFISRSKQGATKNDVKINVSNISDINMSILGTGFPSGTSYETNQLLRTVESIKKFKKIRAIGCASLMLSNVAEGIFDVYYEKDIYLWDVAAGLSMVKEAGGLIYYKKTNNYKYEVLATNNKIFNKAKKILIK